MPARHWHLRLADILDQVDSILADTKDVEWPEFRDNGLLHDAVMFRIGIIGEAVGKLPDEMKDRYPEVPWLQIRAMRNVLTHVYYHIQLPKVWAVIEQELEPLRVQLVAIQAAETPPEE